MLTVLSSYGQEESKIKSVSENMKWRYRKKFENGETVTGFKWNESSIRDILKNEKYKGDVILQKTYQLSYISCISQIKIDKM